MVREKAVQLALISYLVLVFFCFTLILPKPGHSQFLLGYTGWDNLGQTQNIPYTLWGNYGIIPGQQSPFSINLEGYGFPSGQQFPLSANWRNYGFPSGQQSPISANWEGYRLKSAEAPVFSNMQGIYGVMPQTLSPGYTASGASGPYSLPPPGYAAENPYFFPSHEGFYTYQSIINPKAWIGSPMPPAADPEEQFRRELDPDVGLGLFINGINYTYLGAIGGIHFQ